MCQPNRLSFLIILCAFFTSVAQALPADSKQKVFIVADSCMYNYKNGTSIFTGNVKVDQGTTHLTADKLTTKSNAQHKIEEAIAYGLQQRAHYWTVPKVNDSEIHAQANVIKYYPISSNISLLDDVIVTQRDNSFQGQIIHYNMNDETITVPASKNGRAILVYNPDK